MDHRTLSEQLYSIGAVQFGEFTLKSGMRSPFYIDLRSVVSYPHILKSIADALITLIKDHRIHFDLIAGIPYTAIPIATAVSLAMDVPMIYTRKEVKNYGTKKKIEGVFRPGQTCLLLDDLITTGESKFETIAAVEAEGLVVKDIIVLVNREQGGKEQLAEKGYTLHGVLSISEILTDLKAMRKIDETLYKRVIDFLHTHRV